ncbi:MAG: hypothetical protein KBG15_09545 [Kofleriaceae bacterium]|nr:hypothetical protein [Kofleriaceae bacterium]
MAFWATFLAAFVMVVMARGLGQSHAAPPGPAGAPTVAAAPVTRPSPSPTVRRPLAIIDVVGTPQSQALANKVSAALLSNGQLAPISDTTIAAALVGPLEDVEDVPLATATRALVDAEQSLGRFETSVAIAGATSAMTELHRADPTAPRLTVYADLAFVCGRAALTDKNPTQASRWFALTARLAPTFTPDRGRYVSNVIVAYDTARQPVGSLVPLAVTGAGEIVVDGIIMGPAPMTVSVTPGPHVVHLVSPEHVPVGAQIDVLGTGATLQLTALVAPAQIVVARLRRVLQTAPDATGRGAAISKMAKLAGVHDALVISRDSTGELALGTWRDEAPGFAKPEPAAHTTPEKIFASIAPPPVLPEPLGPVGPMRPSPTTARWYQKRWVQASVVGGVLLSAAGIALAITATPDRRDLAPAFEWISK